MEFHRTIILSSKTKCILEVSYSADFMCAKEQLHRNILVLTNYKKQDYGKCILLVTSAVKVLRACSEA